MASLIFNSALRDEAIGSIDFDTDTFKVMLVTAAYVENKDTHTKRSDITNEVVGTGYTAGGSWRRSGRTRRCCSNRWPRSPKNYAWPRRPSLVLRLQRTVLMPLCRPR